jgi:hypothetical protein
MPKSKTTSASRDAGSVVPKEDIDRRDFPPAGVEGETPDFSGRKPGGQIGNNNALKHGFYSRYFTKAEVDRLENGIQGELQDEESLIRLYLARVAETLKDGQMTHDKYIYDLRTISLAVGRIESIQRSRKVVYDNMTSLEKVWEELKYIPVDVDP